MFCKVMFLKFLGLFVITYGCDFELVSRQDWGALPPKKVEHIEGAVPYVIIHHSYIPPACYTTPECIVQMKWMQDFHIFNRTWNDIGYTFAVGGDGKAYEGRGWGKVGAHAPSYNDKSVGIVLIGDWREEVPPPQQLDTVRRLISFGVRTGRISVDYTLFGHMQVREGTECPGTRLFAEISTWPHFSSEVPQVPRKPIVFREG